MARNKDVDAFIAKSQPFARPILTRIRDLIHDELPHVEEAIKWGMPAFLTHGAILGNMAAFKAYCSFGLWKASEMEDPARIFKHEGGAAGSFGRLTTVKDLPADKQLRAYLREADKLNEDRKTQKRPPSTPRPKPKPPTLPAWFKKALSKKAAANFKAMSPSKQREYVEWLVDAKTEQTRERRLATALAQIGEGKALNWKYQR